MNGLDVAGLRPFDLVIPFTIQKGEITGTELIQISIFLFDGFAKKNLMYPMPHR